MNANSASSLGPWLALWGGSVTVGLDGALGSATSAPSAAPSGSEASFAHVLRALRTVSEGGEPATGGPSTSVVIQAPAPVVTTSASTHEPTFPSPAESGERPARPRAFGVGSVEGNDARLVSSRPLVVPTAVAPSAFSSPSAPRGLPLASATVSPSGAESLPSAGTPNTPRPIAVPVAVASVATDALPDVAPLAAGGSAPTTPVPSMPGEADRSVTMAAPAAPASAGVSALDSMPAARAEAPRPTTVSTPPPPAAAPDTPGANGSMPIATVPAATISVAAGTVPSSGPVGDGPAEASPPTVTIAPPRTEGVPQPPIASTPSVGTAPTETAPPRAQPAASVSIPSKSIPAEWVRATENLRVEVETSRPTVPPERALEMPRDFADWTRRVGEEGLRATPRPHPTSPGPPASSETFPSPPAQVRAATLFPAAGAGTELRLAGPVAPTVVLAPSREASDSPPAVERPVASLGEIARAMVPAAPSTDADTSGGGRSDTRAAETPLPAPEAPPVEATPPARPVSAEVAIRPTAPALDLQISKAVAELAVRQEGDRLIASAAKGTVSARLQLQPAHLGALDIHVARRADGRLEITMRAAHESTQRGLEREVDRLVQALGRQDLEVHHVQVRPLVVEASLHQDDARLPREGRSMQDPSPRDPRERSDSDVDSRSGRRRSRRHPGQFDAEA